MMQVEQCRPAGDRGWVSHHDINAQVLHLWSQASPKRG